MDDAVLKEGWGATQIDAMPLAEFKLECGV
jgi:hypothetical protein